MSMFKKQPLVKPSANIKSSERRKLLSQICQVYSLSSTQLPKSSLEDILPPITKRATFKSPLGYSGSILFDNQEIPLWFQTRDSQLYPTVYTLWKCPYLIPTIQTHPHVIDIIGNGADLMIPGTVPPFDSRLKRGAVVGVVSKQRPGVIMALGICKVDMTRYESVIGRTGVAVEIIHLFNDELAKINREVDVPVPEMLDTTMPAVIEGEESEEKTLEEQVGDLELEETKEGNEVPPESCEAKSKEITPIEATNGNANEQQTSPEPEAAEEEEATTEQAEEEDDTVKLTTEEIDNFFTRALLQTIKLDKVDLPITASTFMSSHIYKNLPIMDSSYTNIKKTSYKKTSKYLKAMAKLGYLDVKGKDEDLSIIKLIASTTPIIENFVPHKINKPKSTNQQDLTKKQMNIKLLYKPTSKSRMFFNKLDKQYDSIYTSPELRTLLESYANKFELIGKNKKTIRIDETLATITSNKQGPQVARDQIFKQFLSNFSPHYQIILSNGEAFPIQKGQLPKITIITEMKIGRKIITRVSNFEKFNIKPGAFAEELRNKCSGSSTIGQATHNPSITEVQVQGPHGKLIIEILKDKGIPILCIEFEDKVKKKKGKK